MYAFPYLLNMGAPILRFGYGRCVIPGFYWEYVLLRRRDDKGAGEVGSPMFVQEDKLVCGGSSGGDYACKPGLGAWGGEGYYVPG